MLERLGEVSGTLGQMGSLKTLAEIVGPVLKQAMGFTGTETDERKAARIRASRRAILGGEELPEDQGILLDTNDVAKLLKVSHRHVTRMAVLGEMPTPIRIGRAVRWSYAALKKWIDDGCPSTRNRN